MNVWGNSNDPLPARPNLHWNHHSSLPVHHPFWYQARWRSESPFRGSDDNIYDSWDVVAIRTQEMTQTRTELVRRLSKSLSKLASTLIICWSALYGIQSLIADYGGPLIAEKLNLVSPAAKLASSTALLVFFSCIIAAEAIIQTYGQRHWGWKAKRAESP
jgi:hypothetical protein